MRIAITGSTSMIGIALSTIALKEGHEVIAIVRPGSKRIMNLPKSKKIKVLECEISDYQQIQYIEKCDMFFHLAWEKTFVDERDDVRAQIKNIGYVIDAVDLAKSWASAVFIGIGSQAEFGNLDAKAYENTHANPSSGYGIAKYSAGKMARVACKKLDIRFCWARIFSVYGENDAEYTMIMHTILSLLRGEIPQLTKCEQIWDYIYVEDVAHALLSIGMRGKDGHIYLVSSGECRPLKEYVFEIRDIIDSRKILNFGAKEYFKDQTMILCADIKKLTDDTGFVPKYSFEEGISRTISYIKNQSNLNSASDPKIN